MKRFILQLAVAVSAAFALTAAAPARACDCNECPKHKATTAAPKAGAPAKAEKKEAKPAEKAPAAAPAVAGEKKAEAPTKCECGKGGKDCICKKGECKCANCGPAKFAAADEKPKCECQQAKDCACKKGECKCKHSPKAA